MKSIFTYKSVGYSYIEIDGFIYTFRVDDSHIDDAYVDDLLGEEEVQMIEEEMENFEATLREDELKIWKGEEL